MSAWAEGHHGRAEGAGPCGSQPAVHILVFGTERLSGPCGTETAWGLSWAVSWQVSGPTSLSRPPHPGETEGSPRPCDGPDFPQMRWVGWVGGEHPHFRVWWGPLVTNASLHKHSPSCPSNGPGVGWGGVTSALYPSPLSCLPPGPWPLPSPLSSLCPPSLAPPWTYLQDRRLPGKAAPVRWQGYPAGAEHLS